MTEPSIEEPRQEPQPEFGPRGYLPPRAASRARKIVLRGQMGLGWPLAALGAAVLVLTVGLAFLLRSGPPRPPFRAVGSVTAIGAGTAETVAEVGAVVVRAGGRVRAFSSPAGSTVSWCASSRRLESPEGQVWTPEGILVGGGGTSLRSLPSTVYDGVVYVDPTDPGPLLPADPRDETPGCF